MKHYPTCLCLFALVFFSGCGAGKPTLFVHNSGHTVIVEIDGKPRKSVSSGGYTKCYVSAGEHQITVKRKDKVVFDQTKVFETCPEGTPWRHYLLDPDADTKFALNEVYYYEDQETASKSNGTKRIRTLPKGNWIDVPAGVTALTPMPVMLSSKDQKKVTRRCVMEVTKK